MLGNFRFFFVKHSPVYKFLDFLPVGSAVLDVGCGNCRSAGRLREIRPDIEFYGIDILSYEDCEKILTDFKIINLEQEDIPYPDQHFSGIIMSHVLEHLKNTATIKKEIHRVLKKEGVIFIATPSLVTLNLPKKSSLKKFGIPSNTLNFYDDETHIGRPYSPCDLERWLPMGFEVLMNGYIKNPFKKVLSPIQAVVGIVLRNPDYVSSAVWELFGGVSYVIARKINFHEKESEQ